jgi:hypothetical protein
MEDKQEMLKNISLMALGWIIARSNMRDPLAVQLAIALKENGVQSLYVQNILDFAGIYGMDTPGPQEKEK